MIEAAGVDTWSVCWQLDDHGVKAMRDLATVPSKHSQLLPDEVEGHRVGWFPRSSLLFAEGHPRADGLGGPADMQAAAERLSEGLRDRGIALPEGRAAPVRGVAGDQIVNRPGFAGVRRVDSTVDLSFDDPAEGLAALAGVAALTLPRTKKKLVTEVGTRRVETVYFLGRAGKRVLARWYDKGVEQGGHSRGAWVRPEDQRRFGGGNRLPLEVVTESSYIRDAFVQRFEPLWRASKGVIVAGVPELAKRLNEMVERGELKASTAKSLAGHLVLDAAGIHENMQGRSTVLGDRAKCRDHGLVLADGVLDEVEVDLGQICERLLDSSAWGCQG